MYRSDRMGHLYNTQTVFENLGDAAAAMGAKERARRRRARRGDDRKHEAGANAERPRPSPPRLPSLPNVPKLPPLPKVPPVPHVDVPDVKTPEVKPPPDQRTDDLLDYLLKP